MILNDPSFIASNFNILLHHFCFGQFVFFYACIPRLQNKITLFKEQDAQALFPSIMTWINSVGIVPCP